MGQPAWGFPEDLQKVVLKGEEPITCRPGELLEPIDFEKAREEVQKFYPEASDRNGHLLVPLSQGGGGVLPPSSGVRLHHAHG